MARSFVTALLVLGGFNLGAVAFAHEGAHLPRRELPEKSYEHPAKRAPTPDDYVIQLEQMISFYDVPGEFGHMMVGKEHGFRQLSVILTETQPNGGPPLHTHETEEAHVLTDGTATYVIVDPATQKRRVFTVNAPYVARIPAGFPHTFVNAGQNPFRLVAIFPDDKFTYAEIGRNPLVNAAPPPAPVARTPEEDVRQAISALLLEFVARVDERAMHARFWADDLVYTSGRGEVRTKTQILEKMPAAPTQPGASPTYGAEDIVVRNYGSSAALTFRLVAKQPDGTVQRYRNSGTFVHRNNLWQAVTWQATPVSE